MFSATFLPNRCDRLHLLSWGEVPVVGHTNELHCVPCGEHCFVFEGLPCGAFATLMTILPPPNKRRGTTAPTRQLAPRHVQPVTTAQRAKAPTPFVLLVRTAHRALEQQRVAAQATTTRASLQLQHPTVVRAPKAGPARTVTSTVRVAISLRLFFFCAHHSFACWFCLGVHASDLTCVECSSTLDFISLGLLLIEGSYPEELRESGTLAERTTSQWTTYYRVNSIIRTADTNGDEYLSTVRFVMFLSRKARICVE